MSFASQASVGRAVLAEKATAGDRAQFIRKTYAHLAGAVGLFVVLEYILLHMPFTPKLIMAMAGSRYGWLLVLGLFMGVGYIANRWAESDQPKSMQYAGLILYVAAEAVIFLPLLFVAAYYTSPDVLPSAAIVTLALFGGLTATVFITKKDFSFMRSALTVGSFMALGVIVLSIVVGFNLGTLFSLVMVVLAGGYILYYTSNVMKHYRTDQYVAASLALFAAVALLFWYILQIFMRRD